MKNIFIHPVKLALMNDSELELIYAVELCKFLMLTKINEGRYMLALKTNICEGKWKLKKMKNTQ